MENIIEERKAIPVIGMVSSGKSTFLNSLLGIEILETKDDITTKFVCIIRYKPNLKNPKFYHVLLKKKENLDDYMYIKDGKEAEGLENIKKMISSINYINKEENSVPIYDKLFYVLETDIKNIENKEFLSKYDFYDVPGLNEFISNENEKIDEKDKKYNKPQEKENTLTDEKDDNKSNSDKDDKKEENMSDAPPSEKKVKTIPKEINDGVESSKENMKYIKGLFQYFKNKMDFGIIIIDQDKYYKPQNLQIINELYQIVKLKFENFLFILNKIDHAEDKEKTMQECRAFFITNLDSNIFNIEYNIFAAIDSFQLKNELLNKIDFEYYFKYYFKNYYKEYVNTPKSGENKMKNLSFIDYLNFEITLNIKEKEKKREYLKNLASKVSGQEFNRVIEIYEDIKKDQKKIIDFGIDLDQGEEEEEENESIISLKAFYEVYKEKIMMPEYSEDVKTILNFFNDYSYANTNTKQEEETPKPALTDEEEAITKFKIVFEGLKKYENEKENIIDLLGNDLKKLEKIIYNQRRIYIPFIGVSSAGKSTILNCIVGYYIFPESNTECTTRGIIIKHSFNGSTELFETDIDPSCDYYIFKERNLRPISKGIANVTRYLSSLNTAYTSNQKKHFFILKTPIKLFEYLNLSTDLKERISFIDLPGGDTKGNVMNRKLEGGETTVYQKLIHISTSFCFVNKGRAIRLEENKDIIRKLYSRSHFDSQIKNEKEFLGNCLFIINEFESLKKEEKDPSNIRNDIFNILYQNQNNLEMVSQINAVIFNAKKYSSFLEYSKNFIDFNCLFNSLQKEYLLQFDPRNIYLINIEYNFIKFCYDSIKKKLKSISFDVDEKTKSNEEFSQMISSLIKNIMSSLNLQIQKKDNVSIRKITNILFNCKNKIKNVTFYIESNCDQFFSQIKNQIERSNELMKNQYKNYLNESFKFLDKFFNQNFDEKKTLQTEELKHLRDNIENVFDSAFSKYDFKEIFQKYRINLISYLESKKKDSKEIMEKFDKNIEKALESISPTIEKDMNLFKNEIDEKLKLLNNEIEKIKKNIQELIKKSVINEENTIKTNDKYNFSEINNSFLENLYNNLGIVNTTIAGGIGAGLTIAIFGFGVIPGVGMAVSGIAAISMIFLGFLIGPSREKKFKKSLEKMIRKIDEGFSDQEWNFTYTLKKLKKQLIESYKREIGISCFELKKDEQKDFEEKKALYLEIREILQKD